MSNLSQIRRAEMLEYLNHLKEIHTDDESRIALGKIETALTEKKYGLVWEEHEEEVDKQLVHNIPVFKEIEDKKIVRDNTTDFNFLLEGDNLHSLKLLDKTHKGNIDVIYIDPPYNTKNKEFVYDDNRVGLDDGFRHSKWLSFMGKRLDYAKNLLSDDGIIFINIDENEVHQLKILGDEIFGEDNFLGEFIWKARSGKGGTTALISIEHESILCYAKNKPEANFYMEIRVSDTEKTEQLRQWGQAIYREDRPTMFFPIFFNNLDNKWCLPTKEELQNLYDNENKEFNDLYLNSLIEKYKKENWESFLPIIDSRYGRWRRGYDGIQELIDEELIISDGEKVKRIIPGGNITKTAVSSILPETLGTSANGTKEIKELFDNKKVFDTTKPLSLVKYLINLGTFNKKNANIIDYFAGSGTTGQAVMQLNKEDGGNRKYILCTNNENNICEKITYQRMKNIQEELPHNLKYYKTEFIPKLSEDEEILSSKLLDYIKEMVELENMCEIDGNSRRIILSDEDLSIALTEMEESGVLYIPSFILLTNEIKDSIEERKLEVVTIPDYYFTEELREVNEL